MCACGYDGKKVNLVGVPGQAAGGNHVLNWKSISDYVLVCTATYSVPFRCDLQKHDSIFLLSELYMD